MFLQRGAFTESDQNAASKEIHLHQKTKAIVLGGVKSHELYRAQIASFINPQNAKKMCQSLHKRGIACQIDRKQDWSRVYLGPVSDRFLCKKLANMLTKRQNIMIEKIAI